MGAGGYGSADIVYGSTREEGGESPRELLLTLRSELVVRVILRFIECHSAVVPATVSYTFNAVHLVSERSPLVPLFWPVLVRKVSKPIPLARSLGIEVEDIIQ